VSILDILPNGSFAIEAEGDEPDSFLLPEETSSLGCATDKRIREFTVARTCARKALSRLGLPSRPILRGPNREPLWPIGVVGSITHCEGYCSAAVAFRERLAAIGIDAEPNLPLPAGVLEYVASREETSWLHSPSNDEICWDRLLFSAKESIFKAWFPVTKRWLDFKDAVLSVDSEARTFSARLLEPPTLSDGRLVSAFIGRYSVENGRLLTTVSVGANQVS
jgi:4'-phosphopantetheinyl transferase EntD